MKVKIFKTQSKEINIFSITGQFTLNLALLQSALQTKRPTSIQNERNVLIAGNLVSKKKTNLIFKASFLEWKVNYFGYSLLILNKI